MGIEVRLIEPGETEEWYRSVRRGFLVPYEPGTGDAQWPFWEEERARVRGAFDDRQVAGTMVCYPTELTLPGGALAKAGALTAVTVAATHRRRGVLTDMIRAELVASRDNGEALGILIASEYPIYGRFGYGPATQGKGWTLDATVAQFVAPVAADAGSVRFVSADEMRTLAPVVYDRHRRSRHGEMDGSSSWWDVALGLRPRPGANQVPQTLAVHETANGDCDGYVRYATNSRWDGRRPQSEVEVLELHALSAAAETALWRFLCSIDLVATVKASSRPLDDLLPWVLADARHGAPSGPTDHLWVRPLDVRAALSARTYATAGAVVIEVVDPLGLAGGRYRVDGGEQTCKGIRATPDITMTASMLGALSLGGVSACVVARAGLIDEHRRGALERLDALFTTPQPPWCSTFF